MPDNALRLPTWIERAAKGVAHSLGCDWAWTWIARTIEAEFDAHVATLPVAEPCPASAALLRECREVVEWASRGVSLGMDDRLHAAELLDRVDRAIGEQP